MDTTLKQGTLDIHKGWYSVLHFFMHLIFILHPLYKAFVNAFFSRFGNSRGAAEQIVNNASNTPHRLMEFHIELNQLYMVNVGSAGLDDCGIALFYAIQLQQVLQMRNNRESLPVEEIERSNVQDTDSSVGMSEDTSNIAMG